MPKTTDRTVIRALLAADRPWSAYALGDLAPGFFEKCRWFRATKDAWALSLLYNAPGGVPVLFAIGDVRSVAKALRDVELPARMKLSILPEVLPYIRRHYRIEGEKPVWRMVLRAADFRPVATDGCRRLTPDDLDAVLRLYEDGRARGQSPGFFQAGMLENGVFFGVDGADGLLAAAGTHLVNPAEGLAAIGNVFTRSDARGKGLASKTTAAVAAELFRSGVEMIVLNVAQANATAIGVYERLGFVKHCLFFEGLAVRKS